MKATTYVALSIGVERALSRRGEQTETSLEDLPAEAFPHIHALSSQPDPEIVWTFSFEALIAGLRIRLLVRAHAEPRLKVAKTGAPIALRSPSAKSIGSQADTKLSLLRRDIRIRCHS
ncbi:MAG TPA: hypothetical protein VHC45_11380 [Gaiellaceae bacterium]|nr:hypothetical protein [Gaiellaceae bacterium]